MTGMGASRFLTLLRPVPMLIFEFLIGPTSHCSTNHPSICIAKAVRRYMVNGTVCIFSFLLFPTYLCLISQLPDEGTVCQPDEGFIFPPPSEEPSVDGLNDEDAKLTKVLRELSQVGVIGMPMERW